MIAAATLTTKNVQLQQIWMKDSRECSHTVRSFLSYCGQALKAYIHINFRISFKQ